MCDRPFSDLEEMHNVLITNWNSVISRVDEVYILGDFLYKGNGQSATNILNKLHGKKYLIKGNHEKYLNSPLFDHTLFEWVKDYHEFAYNDARFILFHYPILEWAHYWRKSVHLYGHNHRPRKTVSEHWDKRAVNVGVDVNGFFPISADAVYSKAFGDYSPDINSEADE